MDELQKAYCHAEMIDERLLRETLNVDSPQMTRAREEGAGKLEVAAQTSIFNELKIGTGEGPLKDKQFVAVQCKTEVTIISSVTKATLVTYEAHSEAFFEILSQFGIVDVAGELPLEPIVPYLSQANWIAVRRADRAIAETGVANMRLKMPKVAGKVELAPQTAVAVGSKKKAAARSAQS